MRLHRPHAGYVLAWGGDLDEIGECADWPTKRRRDLDAALDAEAAAYGRPPPAATSAGWAPRLPTSCSGYEKASHAASPQTPRTKQHPTSKAVIGDGDADSPP